MESILLAVLIFVEIGFGVMGLLKKSNLKKEKSIVRVSIFAVFIILVISPIIDWSFRWAVLGIVLAIQALLGVIVIVRKKGNSVSKKSKVLFTCFGRAILIGMAVLPAVIFPQYKEIMPTGEYSVGTKSYTLTDAARKEDFTKEEDNRNVTIQFWYPLDKQRQEAIAKGKFPLTVFSHGAFGYRMSNYSTYQELASHGYIVCSIDHTYHAFMTKQEDGKTVIANMEFINDAMKAQNGDISAEEIYKLEKDWMKLRTGDMKFVLDYIKKAAVTANADPVYQGIDLEHIGMFGHSLGGATAAQIGRDDKDVDAVAVIDGTMLGEITGFENGKNIVNKTPYPKPIINFYNESHYNEALSKQNEYSNMVAYKNALDSYQVVIKGSGHMNFTDLPIISPFLAKLLGGSGNVDARNCIEIMNQDILQFFDRYLKSSKVEIQKERFQ
ncbi:alpha/beta hydrolase family protein [Pseudobacteroides cellulosolvens]|uniref:Platelet-activating factor acetylhydrolase plasma/intracellular isoform II n=1 Tax=Pseudobacteroides cellulosolvens ATCC 35603 = DSM 2933 TaxID=398512 RepID=A0A0L6JK39_9FIRM|nr:hypothetical protein [Pseudobacteroides cellulosolvens]KNY26130.1 Platelet-activating factor acetylhydrolase plasma/intracellular isoform II [Pseudobacteroides cellulosolvens ATCC 35603 = DSM 2933]